MTSSKATMWVLLLAAAFLTSAQAASKAAPPPVDCTSVVISMSDCLSYVTNGSDVQTPEGNCCGGLKQVLKTNPDCLCQAFRQSAQFGVVLNVTKALSLPTACKVHAPSAAKCGLSLAPAGAPVATVVAPAGAPSGATVANAPSSGFGASETSPASAPSKTSTSSAISISVQFIVAGLAATFFSIL